jgi:hypothetical protein
VIVSSIVLMENRSIATPRQGYLVIERPYQRVLRKYEIVLVIVRFKRAGDYVPLSIYVGECGGE